VDTTSGDKKKESNLELSGIPQDLATADRVIPLHLNLNETNKSEGAT